MRKQLLAALVLLAGSTVLTSCANDKPATATTAGQPTTAPVAASATAAPGGAQLWADNCSRCHNIRPPQSYSDAQWEAIVMHMRLRANLTGEEQRTITRFLQASR